MRFGFVLTNLSGGGAEKAIIKISQGLIGRGHDVVLFLLEHRIEYDLPCGLSVRCLTFPGRPLMKGWLGKRWLAWKLKRAVLISGLFDVVISTLPFADEVLSIANINFSVHRIANNLSAEIAELRGKRLSKSLRRLRRYRNLYDGKRLLAVSDGVAEDLRHGLGLRTALISRAYNPFDFSAISAAATLAVDCPSGQFVLHVGRFMPQKRHDLLFAAWVDAKLNMPLVLLTNPTQELSEMISKFGLTDQVIVAGFQTNPYPWMRAASLLVLCSDREGLPNVLIESLICGTPVVSTDCPSGPREILGSCLKEALVPCGDIKALSEKISFFVKNPPDMSNLDLAEFGLEKTLDIYERLGNRTGDAS